MVGELLGHYRILEKVGAGGMGVVYRAHDERLDRDVALKVLPAGTLPDEPARKRFRKEALALARLNHPNVETVHDFDTQADVDFVVMEFIPGVTLSERLTAGPLPERELVRLGSQLAEGLAAAHERGVVHRDLKPGNLRLTPDGRLKILDFGLAKLVRPSGAATTTETLTAAYALAGTLPYMAPEQLRGEAVDPRTDLYAFGAVLYEMATGRRAFREESSLKLADDILHRPPASPGRLNPDLSPRLEEIILKCLEKDAEDRYQSAKELLIDLRRISAPTQVRARPASLLTQPRFRFVLGAAAFFAVLLLFIFAVNLGGLRDRLLHPATLPRIQSLAVLPLENLSGDPEQEYFADGMTESLIASLSKIQALRVPSRTSAMQYKGAKKPLFQVARELQVDALIEGSVLRVGDRVRITVQLIAAAPERHLWADSYDRDLRDVLALHNELARAIAQEIRVRLTPAEQSRLAYARPVNPEAHEAYLRGRFLSLKFTPEATQKAVQYLQQAVEKDPTFAMAYADLAHAYIKTNQLSKAKAAARKALELDDRLGEAHVYLGVAAIFQDFDVAGGFQEMRRGMELSPGSPDVLMHFVSIPMFEGNKAEALAVTQRALELEPLDHEINLLAGEVFYFAREYDRAIEQIHKMLELDPNAPRPYYDLAGAYEMKRMYPEAAAAYEKARLLSGAKPQEIPALRHAFQTGGMDALRRWRLEQLKEASRRGTDSPMAYARLYVALGQKDQALAWLQKGYEQRNPGVFFAKIDPRLDPLRSDPRFQALLRRMSFPP